MDKVKMLYMDNNITDKNKNFRSEDNTMSICSLSTRAGKGSVADAKNDYSPREEKSFKKLMEINGR